MLAMTASRTDRTDITHIKQQTELVADEEEWVASATMPNTDTTMSMPDFSRYQDMDGADNHEIAARWYNNDVHRDITTTSELSTECAPQSVTTRELHGNGDDGISAVSAVIPR